jgi:hypothetical protein
MEDTPMQELVLTATGFSPVFPTQPSPQTSACVILDNGNVKFEFVCNVTGGSSRASEKWKAVDWSITNSPVYAYGNAGA